MKFTVVIIAALCASSSWAIKVNKQEDKDKREAPVGYPSLSHGYQAPALGHDDSNSISIGAGYSVGGAKPTYSLGGHDAGAQLQLSGENLPASGHATIQLAPITLQPGHGLQSSDLSQLMSQLTHGLNTGALTLQTGESYQPAAHGAGQELSLPQYTLGSPKQYNLVEQPSVPSYAAGTKGLGSYSSGPVLFSPSDSNGNAPALTYGAPSAGHSLSGAAGSGHAYSSAPASGHSFGSLSSSALSSGHSGHSFGDSGLSHGGSGYSLGGLSFGGSGHSLGGAGHSLGGAGHSLGGSGHSFGGAGLSFGGTGHSLGGAGHSLGGSGHSLGGAGHSFSGAGLSIGGSIKGLSAGYGAPSKNFKPSAFLGASVPSESGHGLSSLSGSYGAPSFGAFSSGSHGGFSAGSADHGASLGGSFGGFGGGSTKYLAPSYLPAKSSGFGSLESIASFSSDGHFASPPSTTYGVPGSTYGVPATAAHAASNASPQYYVPSKYHSFGGSSSSYRAPSSSHSSLSSYSSGPKHGFGSYSSPSNRYTSVKDTHGAHSENTYNTIKYSEEFKPRGQ